MDWNETNSTGIHLRGQTGEEAVIGFYDLLSSWSPDLRAAFEIERADRQGEFERIVAEYSYTT